MTETTHRSDHSPCSCSDLVSLDEFTDSVGKRAKVFNDRLGERFRVRALVGLKVSRAGGNVLHPGNSPGVTCPIFELLMERDGKKLPTVADNPRPRVELEDAPDMDHLPAICRQHSVSINAADDARTTQVMPYMSEEWEEFHDYARNSIESVNADVKGEGHESIASKGRRKVRGFAAAAVIFAIQLTQYNLRTIATFLKERAIAAQLDKPKWPPTQPIRRRDAGAVNLYTKTLPRDPLLARWAEGELFSPLRT